MTLKNEIEKTMFKESIDDKIQDIATLIDSPVEDVQKRMKSLSFSDYIKLMSAYKANDVSTVKDIMGLMESLNEEDCPACDGLGLDQSVTADEDDRGCDECGGSGKIEEGYYELPSIDTDKYQERDGLEGPIMTRSGKVVYYDHVEGKYYDPDTDIYLTYDEWKAFDPELPIKSEAYSTGSQGAEDGQEVEPSAQDIQAANNKLKSQRTQAMQRLGRDNLGGATAQMAANAIDNAEQGKVLTPIQRQALAHQAQNLDNLAMNKDTRIQFRNLLNKLRNQTDQEGQ